MTSRLDWRLRLATTTSFSRRAGVLAAVTVVAMAMAALLAFETIHPPPTPVRRAKASTADRTAPTPAPAVTAVPPPVEPPSAPTAAEVARPGPPASPSDWAALPIEELRRKAGLGDILAMEELARRLVQGIGVAKDPQAGAGWLLRAAQQGSAQAAFNVGVMYERGFVVERDSTRAVEWYRKAADADLPVAKHNLALLLRDGKGAPRNGKAAIELLRSAARQGMAASMFSLGDIYERGDAAAKDPAAALAWFAITAEFERQLNGGTETALAKTALQRSQALQRVLLPAELERAQNLGHSEFRQIVEALAPPKPAPPPAAPADPPVEAATPPPLSDDELPGWPKATGDQVRAIQQGLVDLKLLRDKPDGVLGPMTRNAIRDFQKGAGLRESGEPTRDVYAALKQKSARRDVVAASPLPPAKAAPPPGPELAPTTATPEPSQTDAKPAPAAIELGQPEPAPPPPTSVDIARTPPRPEPKAEPKPAPSPAPVAIDLGPPVPTPPPPTSVDIARATAQPEPKPELKPAPPPAAVAIDLGTPEPTPPAPTSAEFTGAAPKPNPPPAQLDKPPRPELPKVDAAKPSLPQVPATVERPKAEMPPGRIERDTSKDEPRTEIARTAPPPDPSKPMLPRPDAKAWPAGRADQVKAIQGLLHELKIYRDDPHGQISPATRVAIREYQRMAGLKETGEPSKALFDSLLEMRTLMAPKPRAGSN